VVFEQAATAGRLRRYQALPADLPQPLLAATAGTDVEAQPPEAGRRQAAHPNEKRRPPPRRGDDFQQALRLTGVAAMEQPQDRIETLEIGAEHALVEGRLMHIGHLTTEAAAVHDMNRSGRPGLTSLAERRWRYSLFNCTTW
jgi:hypothetical protein